MDQPSCFVYHRQIEKINEKVWAVPGDINLTWTALLSEINEIWMADKPSVIYETCWEDLGDKRNKEWRSTHLVIKFNIK